MTGPSAPDPAVETVARVLGQHWPEWDGTHLTHLSCSCDAWRCAEAIDEAACSAAEAAHNVHRAEAVVAALRAAAGTADVYDLAEVAGRAMCDARVGHSITDSVWAPVRDVWVTAEMTAAVRAVLDRLATAGAESRVICTCYPSGFSPETYEGPQVDCDMHGQPSVAWEQGIQQGRREMREEAAFAATPVPVAAGDEDAARAVAAASEPAAADDETVDWLAVAVESLSDQWDEEAGGFMDHEVRRRLEACRDELRAALRAQGGDRG